MRDMLEAIKRGDFAFCDKDFKTAIDCYSQILRGKGTVFLNKRRKDWIRALLSKNFRFFPKERLCLRLGIPTCH
ncbi:hypothetical protein FRX31_025756 [Thalictrum thalictroides]|uniref:Uncharacterized protein n=1 Tax=Thalictrum thalictroides TaxID=46969 RepID=A0A7J6VIS9_THATH|nr:hypothetical protein FRX31_025756 [Thalictrum thalictroides]